MSLSTNIFFHFLTEKKYKLYRHIFLQVVILLITISIFFDTPDKINLSLNRFYGWVSYYLFMNMLVYCNAYILFPIFLKKNKIYTYLVSLILFTLFSLLIMFVLQESFYDIGSINYKPSVLAIFLSIISSLLAIFLFTGGVSAFLFFKHWVVNNHNINNLRLATSKSELKYLKSQINPHFLFNMLNNVNFLIEEDPDKASYILVKLEHLLSYQLNESEKEQVELKKEIQFLSNFLELEKVRRDNFQYKIELIGNVDKVKVSPLLFIPFVENSVKHSWVGDKESYVHILFKIQENTLIFRCKNSISIFNLTENEVGGLGLSNIKRRLDLLFGENYFLEHIKTNEDYRIILNIHL